jgi:XTP/dITP diphosphohydrolase
MHRFVFATFNAGKVREVAAILDGLPIRVLGPRDVGVDAMPPEDGGTFLDNAVIKAAHAWRHAGLPAMGDDSGLEVAALDGAPGIRSARFAGDGQDDAANIAKLLAALRGVPDRRARFVCWAACVLGPEWPVAAIRDAVPGVEVVAGHPRAPAGCRLLVATGEVAGRIIDTPAGTDGFGYDPVFFLDDLGRTFAQLGRDQKNALSHRGRAFRALRAAIERMLAT